MQKRITKEEEITIKIRAVIDLYCKKKGINSHEELMQFFDRIIEDPNLNTINTTPTKFRGFLHHLKWHVIKNIFLIGKHKKYTPLDRLKFLCKHLNIPIYEFLRIYNFFNCNDDRLDVNRTNYNLDSIDKFFSDRGKCTKIYRFLCDEVVEGKNWISNLDLNFLTYENITYFISKIKKPGIGIPGKTSDKNLYIIWGICMLYNIPLYSLLTYLGVIDNEK